MDYKNQILGQYHVISGFNLTFLPENEETEKYLLAKQLVSCCSSDNLENHYEDLKILSQLASIIDFSCIKCDSFIENAYSQLDNEVVFRFILIFSKQPHYHQFYFDKCFPEQLFSILEKFPQMFTADIVECLANLTCSSVSNHDSIINIFPLETISALFQISTDSRFIQSMSKWIFSISLYHLLDKEVSIICECLETMLQCEIEECYIYAAKSIFELIQRPKGVPQDIQNHNLIQLLFSHYDTKDHNVALYACFCLGFLIERTDVEVRIDLSVIHFSEDILIASIWCIGICAHYRPSLFNDIDCSSLLINIINEYELMNFNNKIYTHQAIIEISSLLSRESLYLICQDSNVLAILIEITRTKSVYCLDKIMNLFLCLLESSEIVEQFIDLGGIEILQELCSTPDYNDLKIKTSIPEKIEYLLLNLQSNDA